MADLIGQRIYNYEITGILGKGGMAIVYRARQLNIHREVAIKVIKPDLADAEDLIKRFEREANTVAALSHPHILKLFDFGQYEDILYLVMELLTGGTLAQMIRQSPLTPEHAAHLFDQIADALDYAHGQGLIHRDLKPQNILLDQQGNAHLTDFGVAKILTQSTALTQTGVAVGTPAYMSPEQWQGLGLDARADVYALGVMLYEMLTGQLPFSADTPASFMYRHLQDRPPSVLMLKSGLPRAVDQVIQTALAKTPDGRFASAGEMASAFRRAIESSQVDPQSETEAATVIGAVEQPATLPAQAQATQVKTRRPLAALVGGILLVLVVGGVLVTGLLSRTGASTPTLAVTQAATRQVAAASSTASPTTAPTATPVPPTSTPLPPTQTPIPTLDRTAVAQSTNAAIATINAARTQLFIDDQTASATLWTATPTSTFTPMPSPTVPTPTPTATFTATLTFTPSATYTQTPIPTPEIPVWDDFTAPGKESTLWTTSAGRILISKFVDGGLKLGTNEWLLKTARAGSIRTFAALVTLESGGGFYLVVNNASGSGELGITCYQITFRKPPFSDPRNDRTYVDKILPGAGCPTRQHLLLVTVDGSLAHYYVDGQEITVTDMQGYIQGANLSVRTSVVTVHKVWVDFAR